VRADLAQVLADQASHLKHADLGLAKYSLEFVICIDVALVGRVLQFVLLDVNPKALHDFRARQRLGADDRCQSSEDIKDAVLDELKTHFRPEFLNRIDETVVFHALGAAHIASIAKIQLAALVARLAHMDLALDVSDAAVAELAKVGFDPVYGARPLKRAIQQRIENPLSKLLLEGKFMPKDSIHVNVDPIRAPGEFQFSA